MPRGKGRTRRPKVIDPLKGITLLDRKLLEYPPNEGTWRCEKIIAVKEDGTEIRCKMANSGSQETCVICRSSHKDGKLLWPQYVKLCAKLNLEPGKELFKVTESGRLVVKVRGEGKWETWQQNTH